ncbi:hypothetical protein LUZ60_002117 [Juncus effusus]|nr:hypothetical protein LUZ60_002117 [Juncus effusus]
MTTIQLLSSLRRLSSPPLLPTPQIRRARCRRRRYGAVKAVSFSSPPSLSIDGIDLRKRVKSVLPGGKWWRLEEEEEQGADSDKKKNVGLSVSTALSRMWVLVAEDRWVVFLGFTSLIGSALSEICIPHFLAAAIFSAQNGGAMFYNNAKLLVVLCLTSGICSGIRGCCFGIANMILVRRMRETLYNALLSQEISFFDEETVGDLTSRLGSDCQQVSRVIGNDLNLISRNVLQGAGALAYLIVLSWPLGLLTLVICCTLSIIMLIHGRYQKKAAKLTQEYTASANEVAQETISLVRTVRVYGTEKQEFTRYDSWLDKLYNISLRQSVAYGFWSLSFNYLYHSTQVIAVVVGGFFIMSGRITAEKLTKFILYSEWLILSTWWIGDNWSSLMQSVGASEKVFRLMNLVPSYNNLSKGKVLEKLEGRIQFVNVSFSYASRSNVAVLRHVHLTIQPNEVVAIVGLSGSGKSTLVNLLLNLYEPTSGQILVDDTPLSELNIKWLRERIGYVGQEPRLFRTDIASNLKYGISRQISHEELITAAKQAYAHDFISALPNGYETLVDNSLLSGGQKQRIAIARAILRDPKILVLDEATSALDAESEHYIKGVMRSFHGGSRRTVIVIAHRLSTIQAADRIVVMDGGKIVEIGSHKELLQKDGLYSRLAKRQADSFA